MRCFCSLDCVQDNYTHMILGTQFYKPKDFASQINLSVNNMWGILKSIVDVCMKLEDGKFLLVKDPNKPLLRLYEVPTDAFDEDEFEEEVMPTVRQLAFAELMCCGFSEQSMFEDVS